MLWEEQLYRPAGGRHSPKPPPFVYTMESVVYAVAAKDGSTRYGFVLAPAKIESPRVEAFRIKAEDRSWVGSLATEARKGTYQISGEFRKEDPGFLY